MTNNEMSQGRSHSGDRKDMIGSPGRFATVKPQKNLTDCEDFEALPFHFTPCPKDKFHNEKNCEFCSCKFKMLGPK